MRGGKRRKDEMRGYDKRMSVCQCVEGKIMALQVVQD